MGKEAETENVNETETVVENNENDDDKKEEEEEDQIGDITQDQVMEYLKEHYQAHSANIISPHDIAKNIMKSNGIQEAQFQFHLNILGKCTYWIVNGISDAVPNVVQVPGEGFKLVHV